MLKQNIMNKKFILAGGIIFIILLAVVFFGGKDKYSGYYILNGDNGFQAAMHIDGNEITCYTNKGNQGYYHEGYVEKGERCKYVYFIDDEYWGNYCPLILTLLNGDKKIYVDSEKSWNPDYYNRVNKSTYRSFLEEIANSAGGENLEDWLTSLSN